jgi:hypothetical protein
MAGLVAAFKEKIKKSDLTRARDVPMKAKMGECRERLYKT